jgi:Peptidase M50B-like
MSYASNALCGRAFHEAGHAVVARYFGLTVVEIEIRDDASGKTDTVGSTDDLPLIDRIAIHCAGEASRTVFKCRSQNRALDEPVELRELLEGLNENHRLEVRNAGFRRAIEIVKSNAPEVERLAALLIEQRRIGESEIA